MSLEGLKMKNDWLFVKPMPDPEVRGKIAIPHTSENITQRGEVKFISEGGSDYNIKLGDIVFFKKRGAFKMIELNGERLNVLRKDEVLAIHFGDGIRDVAPTKDYVFLEWEMANDKMRYGNLELVRPDSYKEMHYTGLVVAVGPDVKECAAGDRVFFDQFGGIEKFQEDEMRYGFVKESAIYCTGIPKREVVNA